MFGRLVRSVGVVGVAMVIVDVDVAVVSRCYVEVLGSG